MRKIFFLFLALVCFSNFSFSNENNSFMTENNFKSQDKEKVHLLINNKVDKSTFIIEFNSHEDFLKRSESILKALRADDDGKCEITISMTVSVTVEASVGVAGGSITTTVSGSITTSCSNAVAAGKKLRAQLVAMAGG